MGITYVDGIARGAEGQEQAVRFLVDSGARYTLLPKLVWQSLGLTLNPFSRTLQPMRMTHA